MKNLLFQSPSKIQYRLKGCEIYLSRIKTAITLACGSALLVLGSGGVAQSAVLGTHEFSNAGGSTDIFKEYQLTLTVGSASDRYPSNAPIFSGLKVTPGDVGKTFTVNADTDPNFNQFASYLTDGKPDGMLMSTGTGSLGRAGGSIGASGNLFGGNPDLAGNRIDSISVRINSMNLDSPGTNPNGDGAWTDESFNATVIVEGEPLNQRSASSVPEPSSTLGLLAFGAVSTGLIWQRKRHLL